MLKEIFESLSGNIRERASSPLLGSYTVAAIACNWKSLVVLATSTESGVKLVNEVLSVHSGITQAVVFPLGFSLAFSILYPTLKAAISTFNTSSKIMELRAEYRMEEWKQRITAQKNDVESIIRALGDPELNAKIGYHDLKRINDLLPSEQELLINKPSAK